MNKFLALYRDRQLSELLEQLENFGITGEAAIFALSLAGEKNTKSASYFGGQR